MAGREKFFGRRPGFPAKGGKDHFAADTGEQRKSRPVIETLDVAGNGASQKPAQDRHKKLEGPAKQAHLEGVPHFRVWGGHSAAQGNGEGVHSKPKGNEKYDRKSHALNLPGEPVKRKGGGSKSGNSRLRLAAGCIANTRGLRAARRFPEQV
jgi:hypothetical protein